MLPIKYSNKIKRDVNRMSKRGKDISKLVVTLDLLAMNQQMPEIYKDSSSHLHTK